jgi:ATP synthase protein I
MTTAQPMRSRGRPVLAPLTVSAALGLLLVVVAAVVTGSAGAGGAAIGAAMVCGVFTFGGVVLGVVARVSPAASLLVALLTYALQVTAVGLVYVALRGGGLLGGQVDPRWLSAAVIACTLAWTTALVVSSTRTRQPTYDLPSRGPEASVR